MSFSRRSRRITPWLVLLAPFSLGACQSSSDSDRSGGTSAGQDSGAEPGGWTTLAYDLSSTYWNRRESVLSAANVANLKETFSFKPTGGVTGAAAVVGGTAYVVGGNATYALDAVTGAQRWVNEDVGSSSSPTYADGVLYVNGSFGGAILHALDPETGKEKWQATVDDNSHAAGYSSPVVADKYVIVGSSSGEEGSAKANATFRGAVVAFDRTTGKEAWRFSTVDETHNGCAVWSTVSVDLEAKLVFASTGNNYTEEAGSTSDSVFALELDTGKQKWHVQASEGDVFTIVNPISPDSDFGTNPILFEADIDGAHRKLLGLGQKSGVFWVFDRLTGEEIWQRPLGPGSAVGGVLNNGAYDGKRIYVASSGATSDAPGSEPNNGDTTGNATSVLFALDPATGDILWERQLPAAVWAPITIAGGVGFVAVETRLRAFDLASGETLYEIKTEGTIASAPVVSDGRVYFGSGMSLVIYGHPDGTFHLLSLD